MGLISGEFADQDGTCIPYVVSHLWFLVLVNLVLWARSRTLEYELHHLQTVALAVSEAENTPRLLDR